jgi:hypothetical protein
MNASLKEKVAMVPLEKELREAHRRRQVLDQLAEALGATERIIRGGLDGEKFAAYEAFRRALVAATGVVKNFRS